MCVVKLFKKKYEANSWLIKLIKQSLNKSGYLLIKSYAISMVFLVSRKI